MRHFICCCWPQLKLALSKIGRRTCSELVELLMLMNAENSYLKSNNLITISDPCPQAGMLVIFRVACFLEFPGCLKSIDHAAQILVFFHFRENDDSYFDHDSLFFDWLLLISGVTTTQLSSPYWLAVYLSAAQSLHQYPSLNR